MTGTVSAVRRPCRHHRDTNSALHDGIPCAGMLMTGSVGAVYRAMLESLRMLSVWALDLLIWYTLDGEDRRYVQFCL